MTNYMYKAKFNFELGSGESEGEIQSESLSKATAFLKSELVKAYDIKESDITITSMIEA